MPENFLTDAARCGLFHLSAAQKSALPGLAAAAGLRLRTVDLNVCRTLKDCLTEIGKGLDFPDWYGANLDALMDCLCAPDWPSESGDVVLLSGLNRLLRADPVGQKNLLEVLAAASAEKLSHGRPLWLFLDQPLSGTSPLAPA